MKANVQKMPPKNDFYCFFFQQLKTINLLRESFKTRFHLVDTSSIGNKKFLQASFPIQREAIKLCREKAKLGLKAE